MPKKLTTGKPAIIKVAAQISDCDTLDQVWNRIVKNSALEKLDPDLIRLLKSVFMLGFKACVRSKDFNKYVKWSKDLINYIDEYANPSKK